MKYTKTIICISFVILITSSILIIKSEILTDQKHRPEWDVTKDYLKGDLVKWTYISKNPNIIRYFTASVDISSGGGDPNTDNFNWFEDFTLIPKWTKDKFYEEGKIVTVETGGAINFFVSNTVNDKSFTPPNLSENWIQIMLARPTSTHVQGLTDESSK